MKRLAFFLGLAGVFAAIALFFIWFLGQQGTGQLVWDRPDVKKSVLTFAYKIYSNAGLQDGRFFLSKMVFRNTGKKPVRRFLHQLPDPGIYRLDNSRFRNGNRAGSYDG